MAKLVKSTTELFVFLIRDDRTIVGVGHKRWQQSCCPLSDGDQRRMRQTDWSLSGVREDDGGTA